MLYLRNVGKSGLVGVFWLGSGRVQGMAVGVCWGLGGSKKKIGKIGYIRKGTECRVKELRLHTEGQTRLLNTLKEERRF